MPPLVLPTPLNEYEVEYDEWGEPIRPLAQPFVPRKASSAPTGKDVDYTALVMEAQRQYTNNKPSFEPLREDLNPIDKEMKAAIRPISQGIGYGVGYINELAYSGQQALGGKPPIGGGFGDWGREEGREVGGAIAESMVPNEAWEVVLSAAPGVGEVPGTISLIKAGVKGGKAAGSVRAGVAAGLKSLVSPDELAGALPELSPEAKRMAGTSRTREFGGAVPDLSREGKIVRQHGNLVEAWNQYMPDEPLDPEVARIIGIGRDERKLAPINFEDSEGLARAGHTIKLSTEDGRTAIVEHRFRENDFILKEGDKVLAQSQDAQEVFRVAHQEGFGEAPNAEWRQADETMRRALSDEDLGTAEQDIRHFRDIDFDTARSDYARMSPEELEQALVEKMEDLHNIQEGIWKLEDGGLLVDEARRNSLLDTFTEIRKIRTWLDQKLGVDSLEAQALDQIVKNMNREYFSGIPISPSTIDKIIRFIINLISAPFRNTPSTLPTLPEIVLRKIGTPLTREFGGEVPLLSQEGRMVRQHGNLVDIRNELTPEEMAAVNKASKQDIETAVQQIASILGTEVGDTSKLTKKQLVEKLQNILHREPPEFGGPGAMGIAKENDPIIPQLPAVLSIGEMRKHLKEAGLPSTGKRGEIVAAYRKLRESRAMSPAGASARQHFEQSGEVINPERYQASQVWARDEANPDYSTLKLVDIRTGLYNAGLESTGPAKDVRARWMAADAAGIKLPTRIPPAELPESLDVVRMGDPDWKLPDIDAQARQEAEDAMLLHSETPEGQTMTPEGEQMGLGRPKTEFPPEGGAQEPLLSEEETFGPLFGSGTIGDPRTTFGPTELTGAGRMIEDARQAAKRALAEANIAARKARIQAFLDELPPEPVNAPIPDAILEEWLAGRKAALANLQPDDVKFPDSWDIDQINKYRRLQRGLAQEQEPFEAGRTAADTELNLEGQPTTGNIFDSPPPEVPADQALPPMPPSGDDAIVRAAKESLASTLKKTKFAHKTRAITATFGGEMRDPILTELIHKERELHQALVRHHATQVPLPKHATLEENQAALGKINKIIEESKKRVEKFREDSLHKYYPNPEDRAAARKTLKDRDNAFTAQGFNPLTGKIESNWEQAQQVLKEILLGADIGVIGQQMFKALRTGSVAMATRAVASMLGKIGLFDNAILYKNPDITRYAQRILDGLIPPSVEAGGIYRQGKTAEELEKAARRGLVGKAVRLPRKGVEAFTSAQFDALYRVRVAIYEGRLLQARMLGQDISDPLLRRRIADYANMATSTGRGAISPGRAGWERRMFLSSPMTRSQFAEMATVLRSGRSLTDASNTVNQLISTVALFGAVYYANKEIGLIKTSPQEFAAQYMNPLGSNFGRLVTKFKDGDGRNLEWDFLPQFSAERAILRSLYETVEVAKGDKSAQKALDDVGKQWVRYSTGRLNAGYSDLANLMGFGYGKNGRFYYGDMPFEMRLKKAIPAPILAEQVVLEGQNSPMEVGVGAVGGNAYPERSSNLIERELNTRIIPQLHAEGRLSRDIKTMNDLFSKGFSGEYDEAKRELIRVAPEKFKIWEDERKANGNIFQLADDDRKRIEAKYQSAYDNAYRDLLSGARDPRDVIGKDLLKAKSSLYGELQHLYSDPRWQKAIGALDDNEARTIEDEYFKIPEKIAKKHGWKSAGKEDEYINLTTEQWDEVEVEQERFLSDLAAKNPALAARFKDSLNKRDSIFDAHPIIKLQREVNEESEAYYDTPDVGTQRADYLASHPDINIKQWVFYGTALRSVRAVEMALNKQSTGEAANALRDPVFNKPVKLAGYKHPINNDRQSWEIDKFTLEMYEGANDKERTALRKSPFVNAALVYWGRSENIDSERSASILDSRMSALWPEWGKYAGWVLLYVQLPESDIKTLRDKPHMRALLPELDAAVAIWQEFMYGMEPVFKTPSARQSFYQLTGRDGSRFNINPLKD